MFDQTSNKNQNKKNRGADFDPAKGKVLISAYPDARGPKTKASCFIEDLIGDQSSGKWIANGSEAALSEKVAKALASGVTYIALTEDERALFPESGRPQWGYEHFCAWWKRYSEMAVKHVFLSGNILKDALMPKSQKKIENDISALTNRVNQVSENPKARAGSQTALSKASLVSLDSMSLQVDSLKGSLDLQTATMVSLTKLVNSVFDQNKSLVLQVEKLTQKVADLEAATLRKASGELVIPPSAERAQKQNADEYARLFNDSILDPPKTKFFPMGASSVIKTGEGGIFGKPKELEDDDEEEDLDDTALLGKKE
jgi:regulator of replication initiation timing